MALLVLTVYVVALTSPYDAFPIIILMYSRVVSNEDLHGTFKQYFFEHFKHIEQH